ncbi:uncharacterized protein LOC128300801 [Anopheles moucheti]|uniref:uncharacterized protein LOC128300801 n=1 Tax=Anopheles moucheti TaxID=186751 RepID=UPI0022F05122|nr:uncharacterized protein LOC128300801 [Anopheles moucheti]
MSAECSSSTSNPKLLLYRDLFCRICLQYSKGALIPIDAEIKKTTLLDMFIQLTTFEHENNDALPRFMCEQCVSKLTLAYSIREEFISQTELLLKLVVQKQLIKYYEQFPLELNLSANAKIKAPAKESLSPSSSQNYARDELKACEKMVAKVVNPKRRGVPTTNPAAPQKPEQMVIADVVKEDNSTVTVDEAEEILHDPITTQEDTSFGELPNDWDSSSTGTSVDEDDWSYSLNPLTPQKLAELKPVRFRRKYPSSLRKRPKPDEDKHGKKIKQNQFSTTTCYICDTKHDSIALRDDHFRHHIHMLPYECTECIADPPLDDEPEKEPTEQEQQTPAKHIVLRSVIQLNTHMMMHTMPHKCDHCYRRFMSTYLLNHHLWNYHEHSKEGLTCEWCGKRYYTRRPFQEHVRRHKHSTTERFKCDTCGRTFGSNALLKRHLTVHTGERNHKCTYCPRRFSRRCNLLDHLRLHTGERCHKCDKCSQTFNSKASLEKHHQNYHSETALLPPKGDRNIYTLQSDGSRLYRCKTEGCAFTSVSSTIMTQHRQRHNKPFVCEECGQRFVAPKYVRKHMSVMHSGKPRKPYQRSANTTKKMKDELIDESTADLSVDEGLIQEVKLEEELQVEDDTWTKVKDNIIRTEWNAGELNVVREYVVEFVEDSKEIEIKSFMSSQSHREHMDSHANVRRFECDVCDKKFVRRRNLVNHRMSHTNIRPYRCEDCDSATFKYKSDLNRHRKDKHGRLEQPAGGPVNEQIVLMNDDPVMDGMLVENVPEGMLVNEGIELDGTYGEVIETVEESIVVEQPIVSIGIDEVTKEEYIIEYINHQLNYPHLLLLIETSINLLRLRRKMEPASEAKQGTAPSASSAPERSKPVEEKLLAEVSSDDFCRICLLKSAQLKPLMERVDGVMIPEMLYKLCGRQIEVQDGYPRSICQRCFCKLDCAFRFLNEFQKQDERLRSFYWSGSVSERLEEYQTEGNATVRKRMDELTKRHKHLFSQPVKEMCHKETNTVKPRQPKMVDAGMVTDKEMLNLQFVKSEEESDNDMLLEHYVMEEDNEVTYLDYNSMDSDGSTLKDEQMVEMKIDVIQSADEAESYSDEKPSRSKDSKVARRQPEHQRRKMTRVKLAPIDAMDDSIQTDTDDQTQDQLVYYEDSATEVEEEEEAFDPLHCYICDSKEQSEELLEHHLDLHSTMLPYDCKSCVVHDLTGRTIKTVSSLHNHFRSHLYPYWCDICGKRFLRKAQLAKHKENHSNSLFVCDECGRGFTHKKTKARLDRHVRLHTGDRPYQCKYCSKRYYDRHQLQCHTEKHFRDMECSCEYCGETFGGIKLLDAHKLAKHLTGQEREDFLASRAKRVKRPAILKEEHQTCPYPDCNYTAKTYGAMYVHKRTKHKPVHRCDMCNKSFAFLNQFQTHMKLHTGEKPFQCEICGRSFRRGFSYKEHMEMHTSEANYNCPTCNKSFKRPRYLQAHMLTHTAERKFSCEMCGNSYKTNGELKKHNKNKHGLDILEQDVVIETEEQAFIVEYVN